MQKLPFIRLLALKINFSFYMKFANMDILEDSLVNANDISIMIEKEFTVECCVVMYTKANGKQKSTVNGKLVTKQDLVQLYKISMQWH